MSKSTAMLRTRRRDNNVKPNRREPRFSRLDRKSSRGMIYENEELRLRTININAEIERGQADIKKLRRENEMLKKEIWWLRDEYKRLGVLLKQKEYFSSSSTTCSSSDSKSCSSCSEESDQVETSQNLENVQKTNMYTEFDHLSVVPEENSAAENSQSDRNSAQNDRWANEHIIQPDQSYPTYEKSNSLPTNNQKNLFPPPSIHGSKSCDDFCTTEKIVIQSPQKEMITTDKFVKSSTDLIVKTDNKDYTESGCRSTFSNGGNLEELLQDIETISQDILKITTTDQPDDKNKPYKSELSVVLMPNPMPLLGFEKYKNIQNSFESLHSKSDDQMKPAAENPFFFGNFPENSDLFNTRYNPDNFGKVDGGSKTNLLDLTSSELISSENEENLKFKTTQNESPQVEAENKKKSPKLSIRRKVSIHFKGKKDKTTKPNATPETKKSFFDIKFRNSTAEHQKTSSLESKKSTTDPEPKTPTSSGSDRKKLATDNKKQRKSASVSPDRNSKHVHVKDEKKHKKHKKGDGRRNARRNTLQQGTDRTNRERSFSVCTDKSNVFGDHVFYDEYGMSERERTNSLSSCDSEKVRKLSSASNIHVAGKVPWCGCWGNGCM